MPYNEKGEYYDSELDISKLKQINELGEEFDAELDVSKIPEIPTLDQQAADVFWVPVKSSNVAQIAHSEKRFDAVSWLYRTLFVEFHSGSVYAYTDVPRDIFIALRDATSVGKYLNSYIKGRYSYIRLS